MANEACLACQGGVHRVHDSSSCHQVWTMLYRLVTLAHLEASSVCTSAAAAALMNASMCALHMSS